MNTSAPLTVAETPGVLSSLRRVTAEGVGLDPRTLSASSMKVDPVVLFEMHAAGATDKEMAEHFGVDRSRVRYHRHTLSLPFNPTPPKPKRKRLRYRRRVILPQTTRPDLRVIDPDIACTLRALGLPYAAIGELCGVTKAAVWKCIRRHAQ